MRESCGAAEESHHLSATVSSSFPPNVVNVGPMQSVFNLPFKLIQLFEKIDSNGQIVRGFHKFSLLFFPAAIRLPSSLPAPLPLSPLSPSLPKVISISRQSACKLFFSPDCLPAFLASSSPPHESTLHLLSRHFRLCPYIFSLSSSSGGGQTPKISPCSARCWGKLNAQLCLWLWSSFSLL